MARVLVLDDDPETVRVITEQLSSSLHDAYTPVCVATVAQAYELAGRDSFAFYFVGYMDRESDGGASGSFIEFLLQRHPEARVALLTDQPLLSLDAFTVDLVARGDVRFVQRGLLKEVSADRIVERELGRPVDVLVIEDDPDDRLLIAGMLETASLCRFRPTVTASVAEALQLVRDEAQRFDAYVIDYRLPPQTGLDFIRGLPATLQRVPMVLLTCRNPIEFDVETVNLIGRGDLRFLSKSTLSSERLVDAILRGTRCGADFLEQLAMGA